MERLPVKRALLSATNKSGLTELGGFLAEYGVELVSTGGTYRTLSEAGLAVTPVKEVTGFPEVLGGRVKTLHPHIHAGILADKDDPEHIRALKELDIAPFDLICVNLYDFAGALERGLQDKELVEEIDIGGPTLLRAAAKNYHSVAVLPDTSFYSRFQSEMRDLEGSIGLGLRKELAAYTFSMISRYDRLIATGLGGSEDVSTE
ncbi:MAG: IMP cyclohydrolase [Desulfohalobiaceae bacterium]|nr:IMP cyclohydrolase [Desulfohalobiaceae bacterium]